MNHAVCLTCDGEPKYRLVVERAGGLRAPAVISRNKGEIPPWYKRAGIYSPLPPPLNCNPQFNPWRAPLSATHAPKHYNDKITLPLALLRKLDASMPPAAPGGEEGPWFFLWAARPREWRQTSVRDPEVSYADFSNSALAQAKNDQITFRFASPVPYAVDGVPYPPHVHIARLLPDDTWDTQIWSVNVPPLLARAATVTRLIQSKKYLGINALPPDALGGRHIPGTWRLPSTMSLSHLYRNLSVLPRHTPLLLYCAHAKCDASHTLMEKLLALGYTNLLYPGGLQDWFGQQD